MKTSIRTKVALVVTCYLVGVLAGCQLQSKSNSSTSQAGSSTDQNSVSAATHSSNRSDVGPTHTGHGIEAVFNSNSSQSDSNIQTAGMHAPTQDSIVVSQSETVTSKQSIAEWILFQPVKYPKGFKRLVIEGQQVRFESEDGTQLDGRYFRGIGPKHVVVYFHGNGGNLGFLTSRMEQLQKEHGVAMFIFDYRGYGRSEGKPTVSGAIADGRAAVRKAAELANCQLSDVILMGRSLGGAVAIQLASEFNTKGLIIESSFTSFKDIAKHHAGLANVLVNKNALNSVDTIKRYRGKLLISHGTKDKVVPFKMGKQLFDSANEPKQFYEISNGGHNDSMPELYQDLLSDFFKSFGVSSINNPSP